MGVGSGHRETGVVGSRSRGFLLEPLHRMLWVLKAMHVSNLPLRCASVSSLVCYAVMLM